MDEAAAAAMKMSRLEHDCSVGDEPSFRMENLPEEIQPVVMSLLPLKEAVRTSIVARSWRMLWTFHSNLCFYGPNNMDYHSEEYYGLDEQVIDDFIKTKRAKFIEDVNWVIQRHSGVGINKFSIRCGLRKEEFDHLDTWIAFATSSKAKVIEFDMKILKMWPSKEAHHFPLEALDIQGISFVQSLFLADVSVKPHSVKTLNVRADIYGYEQLQKLTTKSHGMFTRLRHMTCQLIVRYSSELPKADNGVLQLAHCLYVVPQLQTLHLDMAYFHRETLTNDEVVVEEEGSPMRRHDHLKTVYISGFRLYGAQKKLACCILENAPLLEQMQLEAKCADGMRGLSYAMNISFERGFVPQVREWARLASLRFGKEVTAVDAPSEVQNE
ncbi:unnamed protein product [Alopecurus aequalis]